MKERKKIGLMTWLLWQPILIHRAYIKSQRSRRLKRAIKRANKEHTLTGYRYFIFELQGRKFSKPKNKKQLEHILKIKPIITLIPLLKVLA